MKKRHKRLAIAVGAAFGAGQPERARQLAQQALDVALHQIKLSPENVRAYYFAAIMQLHLGDPEAGRRNIATALSMRPDDYGTLYNAACFHALAGEPEQALELLERAIGVIYRPQTERLSHYFSARLGAQFDAVLHIDRKLEPALVDDDPLRHLAEGHFDAGGQTFDGARTYTASTDDLGEDRDALSPLFHAAHEVITAVRIASQ